MSKCLLFNLNETIFINWICCYTNSSEAHTCKTRPWDGEYDNATDLIFWLGGRENGTVLRPPILLQQKFVFMSFYFIGIADKNNRVLYII